MIERGKPVHDFGARRLTGHTDRALRHRGQHVLRIQYGGSMLSQTQPRQSGDRQQSGVDLAIADLAQARLHIAAQRLHRHVGPARQHLRPAP